MTANSYIKIRKIHQLGTWPVRQLTSQIRGHTLTISEIIFSISLNPSDFSGVQVASSHSYRTTHLPIREVMTGLHMNVWSVIQLKVLL